MNAVTGTWPPMHQLLHMNMKQIQNIGYITYNDLFQLWNFHGDALDSMTLHLIYLFILGYDLPCFSPLYIIHRDHKKTNPKQLPREIPNCDLKAQKNIPNSHSSNKQKGSISLET
jgi:hypothetical protein